MRALGRRAARPVPEADGRLAEGARGEVDLLQDHALRRHVRPAVVVPEQVRVDALGRERHGVGPGPLVERVRRREDDPERGVARPQVFADDVEHAVAVPDRGGVHAGLLPGRVRADARELALAAPRVFDQFPVSSAGLGRRRPAGPGTR